MTAGSSSIDIAKLLDHISPACDRNRWVTIGAAIKEEGGTFEMFDTWSAGDLREGHGYAGSEVTRKVWDSFNGSSDPATAGTLIHFAREEGYDPFSRKFYGWSDVLDVDPDDFEPKAIRSVDLKGKSRPMQQIVEYLEACFKPDDKVNVIPSSYLDPKDDKYKPFGIGILNISVEEYICKIRTFSDEQRWFDLAFGSYDHDAGVWIRVNPTYGHLEENQKGISDRNIASYENLLIECDTLPIDEQIARIKELNLPYKALVYTGGKSVHAIIRIDALSVADYKQRAKWLFEYCGKHGFPIDTQNSNPSRMSRLPGVDRGKQKQTLLETAKPIPFDEWKAEAIARDEASLLEIDSLADTIDNLPPMNPELIQGVLREGHKMLISGPSKAGKSFALIALAIAVAEGRTWMNHPCRMGKVLYLNLEIDRPSFLHRMADVYEAMGIAHEHPENIDVLHLRGMCEPLDMLSRKLNYLIKDGKYSLLIVDPIYKVITGDENSAGDMGRFCNLFDALAKVGGCAVAYCHHHSKGSQAGKNAIDRASGSGVFARDPDAIVDLTELDISDADREQIQYRLREKLNDRYLHETGQWANLERYHPEMLMDAMQKEALLNEHINKFPAAAERYIEDEEKTERLGKCRAYRMSITLREFASPEDSEVFFDYPAHVPDPAGCLKELFLAGDNSYEKLAKRKAEKAEKRKDERREWYDAQREAGNSVTIAYMMQSGLSKVSSKTTVRKWVDEQGDLKRVGGLILYANEPEPEIGADGKPLR